MYGSQILVACAAALCFLCTQHAPLASVAGRLPTQTHSGARFREAPFPGISPVVAVKGEDVEKCTPALKCFYQEVISDPLSVSVTRAMT